jgi:hypothetical protein
VIAKVDLPTTYGGASVASKRAICAVRALTEVGSGALLERGTSAFAGGANTQSSYSAHERRDPLVKVQTEFFRGFGGWLISHRGGLVCSTHESGYLLFVGARADGQPVSSAASFSFAVGLAASSQRICLSTRKETWRLETISAVSIASEIGACK